MIIHASSPDDALNQGLTLLAMTGKKEPSRNGAVLVAPFPVLTTYATPRNRVSLSPERDANPFFHLFEALWMLAGRADLEFLTQFVPRFKEFSDDGRTLNGAYGWRWRYHFGTDQLYDVISELQANPASRRAVIAMWDGRHDRLPHNSRDIPCNTHVYLRVLDGRLNLGVCCRSNDIVWGAYGANVVHFSFLQEFIAAALELEVGTFTQYSWNYHAYCERPDVKMLLDSTMTIPHLERENPPLFTREQTGAEGWRVFDRALRVYLDGSEPGAPFWRFPFISEVAEPMLRAHQLHKAGETQGAIDMLDPARYLWHAAGAAWLQRRLAKKAAATEVR